MCVRALLIQTPFPVVQQLSWELMQGIQISKYKLYIYPHLELVLELWRPQGETEAQSLLPAQLHMGCLKVALL